MNNLVISSRYISRWGSDRIRAELTNVSIASVYTNNNTIRSKSLYKKKFFSRNVTQKSNKKLPKYSPLKKCLKWYARKFQNQLKTSTKITFRYVDAMMMAPKYKFAMNALTTIKLIRSWKTLRFIWFLRS